MLSINYPEKYKDEASRVGKKFKYLKIEPFELNLQKEEKKQIKIGRRSGRIAATQYQGDLKQLKENILAESFSDIIDTYLEQFNGR